MGAAAHQHAVALKARHDDGALKARHDDGVLKARPGDDAPMLSAS